MVAQFVKVNTNSRNPGKIPEFVKIPEVCQYWEK